MGRATAGAFTAFSIAILGFVGCSQSTPAPEQRLLGSWEGTIQIDETLAGDTLSEEQIENLKSAQMQIEFQADGTMNLSGSVTGKPSETSGSWGIVSASEHSMTIKSSEADGKTKDVQLNFSGDNAFSMPLPGPLAEAGSMEFRRLR